MAKGFEHDTVRAQATRATHLLIVACSQRKTQTKSPAPAIEVYDGVNFRVLRKFLRENGRPFGFAIKILSARYGLIDDATLIKPYDQRLDKERAGEINRQTLSQLSKLGMPARVFVNLGKDYLPAVAGLDGVFPDSNIFFAPGPIGVKMKAMKDWLRGL